jgi:polyisoprenyl-phosphate glycosyltransferase
VTDLTKNEIKLMDQINKVDGLSFVIPVFNEEGAVVSTLERVKLVLSTIDVDTEIIVVDDGSTDNSAQRALSVKGVNVISQPKNAGYGRALKTGIAAARHHWIAIVDADGTYPIEQLKDLVDQANKGFDMVVGLRENTIELDKPIKRFFRGFFVKGLQYLLNKPTIDPNSGFRIFRRDMAVDFIPFLCNTFSFTTSITVFAIGGGYFVDFVPIQYAKRTGKTKVRHFRDSLRAMQVVFQGVSYFNPVKFFLVSTTLFVIFFVLPALIFLIFGYSNWAISILIVGAVLTLMSGIAMNCDILRIASTHNPKERIDEELGK